MNVKENLKKGASIFARIALPIGTSIQIYEDAVKRDEIEYKTKNSKLSKYLYFASRLGLLAKDFAETALINYSLGSRTELGMMMSMGENSLVQMFTARYAFSRGESKLIKVDGKIEY